MFELPWFFQEGIVPVRKVVVEWIGTLQPNCVLLCGNGGLVVDGDTNFLQCVIVEFCKDDLGDYGPTEAHKHVPLCVPDISLTPQKIDGLLVSRTFTYGYPPFYKFIKSADSQTHASY